MRKTKKTFAFLFLLIITALFTDKTFIVCADAISDSVTEQLNNLDLSKLEQFFNSIFSFEGISFTSYLTNLLSGNYNINFSTIISYVLNVFLNSIIDFMPTFISIISICIFSAIIKQVRNSFLSESVAEIAFYICMCTIAVLLLGQIVNVFNSGKIVIKNIAILSEIMSPIILTLMIAIGGNVSATVYNPAVTFLTNGVINLILYVLFPLIIISFAFSFASNFSSEIKLSKFSDFINSSIKWIIGITATVFGVFLSIQGITSACYDGISIKAIKYTVSNSIPIVGGFLKDGFDLIVAGSVLIKQAIGLSCVFGLFFLIISPVLSIAVFSLMLKLCSAIIETVSDARLSNFCLSITKSLGYVTAVLLLVGFMFFIMVLLMIFSANAFI